MTITRFFAALALLASTSALAYSPYLTVHCRQLAKTSDKTLFFFVEDNAVTLTPEGLLVIRGQRADFRDVADPSATSCLFGYRVMQKPCNLVNNPKCWPRPVFKQTSTNVVEVLPLEATTIQTCVAGSSVDGFEDKQVWLDQIHSMKYPAPHHDLVGTRLDPLKRECLR
jgi:hypothetical protein